MLGRSLIAGIALLGLASEAHADEREMYGLEIPRARPMREQLLDAVDNFSAALDEHLGILTNDVLELQFDGRRKRGRVRVHGELSGLALGVDSHVQWARGGAHVHARINLRLGDHALGIDVPEFEVRPTVVDGERGVEIRVPLFTGSF